MEQTSVSAQRAPIVTVVGSSNTDLTVRVAALPRAGETVLGRDVQRAAGGKGANQSVAACRLGAVVYFVGCLGGDSFGDEAAGQLAAAGLRLDYLRRAPDAPSGLALIAVAAGGENSIVVAPGANSRLSVADVEQAAPALRAAQVVVAQLEIPAAPVQRAFELARTAGATTLLNPAPAQALGDGLLALTDVLVCNETEAQALTGLGASDVGAAEAAALALLSHGPRLVALTRGAAGCTLASQEGGATHVPAFPVRAVDATAAGDAFIGALACQLAVGVAPPTAVRYASAAAALSVQRAGAQPSLPTAEEVDRFLASR
jgi:ribokinase